MKHQKAIDANPAISQSVKTTTRVLKVTDTAKFELRHALENKEWIYKSFYAYLFKITLRYIKRVHEAEEIVNDSFLKIFRNLHHFSCPEDDHGYLKAFKAWMAKIASRTAIDFLRVDKNTLVTDELTEQVSPPDTHNPTEKIQIQEIMALLNELPEIQRLIFNMFDIEGYSHAEIAENLNIPVKNSRVYLARAKHRLRILYRESVSNIVRPRLIDSTLEQYGGI